MSGVDFLEEMLLPNMYGGKELFKVARERENAERLRFAIEQLSLALGYMPVEAELAKSRVLSKISSLQIELNEINQ
jgi:hypothetical protein